ncbi:hypothetical protein [Enterococcus casseliflavus]|uniref:hypothetical protein n=1 Tax=Enterococcus casseliflavus TaxID=37734 RepID=UPI00301AFDE5
MEDQAYERFKRIANLRGSNTGESMSNHSIRVINDRFTDSPSYRKAQVVSRQYQDIKEIDCRVTSVDRLGTLRDVIFRPNEGLENGTYLLFDKSIWIIYDTYLNTISPKATVQQCNEILKFRASDDEIKEYYAFVGASDLGSKAKQSRAEIKYNKYDMREPTAQSFVYVESNEYTNELDVNSRLMIGNRAYLVVGKDDMTLTQPLLQNDTNTNFFKFGILILSLKLDTTKAQDDIENGVAQDLGQGTEKWGF